MPTAAAPIELGLAGLLSPKCTRSSLPSQVTRHWSDSQTIGGLTKVKHVNHAKNMLGVDSNAELIRKTRECLDPSSGD